MGSPRTLTKETKHASKTPPAPPPLLITSVHFPPPSPRVLEPSPQHAQRPGSSGRAMLKLRPFVFFRRLPPASWPPLGPCLATNKPGPGLKPSPVAIANKKGFLGVNDCHEFRPKSDGVGWDKSIRPSTIGPELLFEAFEPLLHPNLHSIYALFYSKP